MEIEILKKIGKVRSKLGKISKDANNPFFKSKYVTLEKIQEILDPICEEVGLYYSQPPTIEGLETILYDMDGNSMTRVYPLNLTSYKSQDLGSAITYARRYFLVGIFSIIITNEDDDGNSASNTTIVSQDSPVEVWFGGERLEKALSLGTVEQLQSLLSLKVDSLTGKKFGISRANRELINNRIKELEK